MQRHTKAAPKTRNERRGVVKMFLQWCVEKDYLAHGGALTGNAG